MLSESYMVLDPTLVTDYGNITLVNPPQLQKAVVATLSISPLNYIVPIPSLNVWLVIVRVLPFISIHLL
jgi:hypothetical protein